MKKCQTCNQTFDDTKKFCNKCGKPLEASKGSESTNAKSNIAIFKKIIISALSVLVLLLASYAIFIHYNAQKKNHGISKVTKNVLRKLDDVIIVKVFFSENLPSDMKAIESNVHNILSEYKSYAGKNLQVTYEDPTKSEEEKRMVVQMGIPERQMQFYEKDKAQIVNGFMGIAVFYGAKKEVMPVVQNLTNFEYDLRQAIVKVWRKENPKIGVLKTDTFPSIPSQNSQQIPGNPEEVHNKFKLIFDNLEKNYTIETVNVSYGKPVDPDIKMLIIPGGTAFSNRMLFEIDQYFMKGGSLIVFADAIKVSLQQSGAFATPQDPGILKLLEKYGVRIDKCLVCDASCGQVQVPQKVGQFQSNVAMNYPYFVKVIREGLNQNNPAVSMLDEMVLPWVCPISLLVPEQRDKNEINTGSVFGTVLIKSSLKSWVVGGEFNLAPQQKWMAPPQGFKQSNLVVYLTGNFKSFFAGKQIPLVNEPGIGGISDSSARDRTIVPENKGGRLVVVGESAFLTSSFAMPGNAKFICNIVDWLSIDDK
jgi:gliding-associated putative ABC transporter substrate-binding component GldG